MPVLGNLVHTNYHILLHLLEIAFFAQRHVTFYRSLVTNGNSHSHIPPPANSPIMPTRLGQKEPKTHPKKINFKFIQTTKTQKTSRGMPKFAICSLTKSLQSTDIRVFSNGPNTQTCDSQTSGLRDGIGPED